MSKTRKAFSKWLVLAALSLTASLLPGQVTLSSPASPASGQPGTTSVTLTGSGFPTGTISPASVVVKLEPSTAGAGPTVTAPATSVTTVVGSTRRVVFVVPSSAAVAVSTAYLISISGTTAANTSFSSTNKAAFTVNAAPALLSISPASGIAGQSLAVVLNAQLTSFVQGTTQASFGPSISVGGGAAGGFGPVFVLSSTKALAVIQIPAGTAAAVNAVTVKTGAEQVSLANSFTVNASGTAPASTVVTLASPTSPTSATPGTTTVTISATNFPPDAITAGQITVLLEPATAGAGPTLTTAATAVTNVVNGARQVSFVVPSSYNPASPVPYLVSLYGSSSNYGASPTGFTFGSSNRAALTIGQTAALLSANPNSGTQGATLDVVLTGQGTHFVQGQTKANFGAGIAVGGAAVANFGVVTVTSPTTATAHLQIDPAAAAGARTVQVSTGSESVALVGAFTVQAVVVQPAVLLSIAPASGQQGQTVGVTVTGANTAFSSSTTLSLGAGITVSNVLATSATTLTAQLAITLPATLGARTVTVTTGAQVLTLPNAFTVLAPAAPATLVSVVPGTGFQGATVPVTLTGSSTHFSSSSTLDFGAGITFSNIVAGSATSITANAIIAPNAVTGARNVTVTTGAEGVTLVGGFTVQASNPGTIASITPALGVQGANVIVTIVGQGTSFIQGTTTADFGAGITITSIVIADATHATVQVTVTPGAAIGPRDVKLTTNSLITTSTAGFRVAAPGPTVTIGSPVSSALFTASPITVTGTVSDTHAVVKVNGVAATLSGNTFTATGVPLAEASNTLVATATNTDGVTGSASITVILDTTPPTIGIDTPTNGAMVTSTSVTVSGMVNDIVSGTINAQQVTVTVNGLPANVSNRSFEIQGLLLVKGQNKITAVATDRAGNQKTAVVNVTVQTQAAQQIISIISGNAQVGPIGTQLPNPLKVQLLDANTNPVAGRAVTFSVRRSDGMILASGQTGQSVTLTTDSKGFAQVLFQLGSHVGAGMNQVQVTSPGFMGETIFCATTTAGPVVALRSLAEITSVPVGVAGQTLSKPLQAIALDAGGNPVSGAPVVFTVQRGGGNFAGQTTFTGNTDSDGKASVLFTLGMQEGISNNVVSAALQQLPSESVNFQASGVVQGATAATTLSGVALDNSNNPIPHAHAFMVANPSITTFTDDQGRFSLSGLPPGFNILEIDGSTSTRPERIPFLTYPLEIIAGQDNSLGKPAYLPIVDAGNAQIVGGPNDVVLTMSGVPGVAFTVFANSVTFPDGSHVGSMSLSQVHADKVPHAPPYGTVPKVVWTLQPAGTLFNPPIRVQLPNTDNLAPGQVVEIFQIDHDLHQFVSVGMARVSADGSVLVTDAGFGVTKAGWGVPAPPPPPKYCADGCQSSNPCLSGQCVNGACQFTPSNEGGKCGDSQNQCGTGVCHSGSCQIDNKAADGMSCTPDDKCAKMPGMCEDGQCKGEKREFQTKVGAAIEGSLAVPAEFKSKLKSLFAALGSGDVDVEDVKVGVESNSKDCCSQEKGFIPLGEQEASAGASLTVNLVDVPLYGVKLHVEVDFIVVSAELTVKVGVFWKANLAFGGKITKVDNACDDKDSCLKAELALSSKIGLRATFAAEECIETLFTAKSCDGLEITPAEISSTVAIGFSYNKASCSQGAEGFISFGNVTVSGEVSITVSNVKRKVGYEWELYKGLTLYWP